MVVGGRVIRTKEDLQYYLEADRIALGIKRKRPRLFGDEIWKFQRLLRELEFLQNVQYSLVKRVLYAITKFRYHELGLRLGITIPCNVCGPGLSIAHIGTIVINDAVRIGKNCRLHVCVNIGAAAGRPKDAPIIGDNVYVGPGAKLYGAIQVADNIAIGANAVVNKSFFTPGVSIAGVPAKQVSEKGSEGLLIKGADLVSCLE